MSEKKKKKTHVSQPLGMIFAYSTIPSLNVDDLSNYILCVLWSGLVLLVCFIPINSFQKIICSKSSLRPLAQVKKPGETFNIRVDNENILEEISFNLPSCLMSQKCENA